MCSGEMMRGHGCSACHPEPGRLVLANGGEGSALEVLSLAAIDYNTFN
jgi:hypothetical protein